MKLIDIKNWKAIHFKDRTILNIDKNLYSKNEWNRLVNLDVEPMQTSGHYKPTSEI